MKIFRYMNLFFIIYLMFCVIHYYKIDIKIENYIIRINENENIYNFNEKIYVKENDKAYVVYFVVQNTSGYIHIERIF